MRRLAGLDRQVQGSRYGVSAHVELEGSVEPFVDVHFHRGYEVYVTPVGGQSVNVAVLFRKSLLRHLHHDLGGWFVHAVAPALGPAAHHLLDAPQVAGPFARVCTRPWRGNVILVGDAAGFFDAVSGEGMSSALISARYCAAAINAFLQTDDERAFDRYAVRRARLLRNSDLLARLTLALAARPAIAQLAVHQLAHRPQTFDRLVRISSGDLPLSALRPSDVWALLPVFWTRRLRG
jgi:flavin-dependent dehydrogenase